MSGDLDPRQAVYARRTELSFRQLGRGFPCPARTRGKGTGHGMDNYQDLDNGTCGGDDSVKAMVPLPRVKDWRGVGDGFVGSGN